LIASGSNDKKIKLLVCPDFDKNEHSELLEMSLEGHSAIVRTLCFNPTNDLILLSGGLVDRDVKVWDSETGKNIANMKGHLGDVYSIKMSNDGSFAFSVGKDKTI
jgi:WD40 repeat protein